MNGDAIRWALAQRDLHRGLKLTLVAIACHANRIGQCYPGIALLARETSTTPRTVQRDIAQLSLHGLIEVQTRHNSGGGQTSNLYSLPLVEHSPTPPPSGGRHGLISGGQARLPPRDADATLTTREHPFNEQPHDDGGGAFNLPIFPPSWNFDFCQEAASATAGLDLHQQQLLIDEFAGRLEMRPVTNPRGYLRALRQKLTAGEFTPELALRVAARRQTIVTSVEHEMAAPPDVALAALRQARKKRSTQPDTR